jgi:hypothetical protein
VEPTWLDLLNNLDRIGAYAILMGVTWGLISGRLITAGRLQDSKDLITALREENATLRAASKETNDALRAVSTQMQDVNHILERLVDDPPPRRSGRGD